MTLTEAFRALDALNEDTFSVSDNGIEKLADFQQNDDLVDEISVIDPNADTEEELQDSYVGKVILDCCVCHSKIYKDKSEVTLDEDEVLANIDEECPFCYTVGGFKVIGEVVGFDDDSVKHPDSEVSEVSESLNESYIPAKTVDQRALDVADYLEEFMNDSIFIDNPNEYFDSDDQEAMANTFDALNDFAMVYRNGHVDEKLTEDVNNVNVETDDSIINVTADENGRVSVTTEPNSAPFESKDEIIAPVSPETQAEIQSGGEEDDVVDTDLEEFDEDSFDELGESYLKNIYENVEGYNTTDVKVDGNKMIVEGVIKFSSGNAKQTSFIFESKDCTRSGKYRFIGENVQLTRGKKAFTLSGKVENKKFITESLNYNYRSKEVDGKSSRIYGTINRKGVSNVRIKMINEGFRRLYESPQSSEFLDPAYDLRSALRDVVTNLEQNSNNNIKNYEIAFQDVIERFYPDKAWWEVCDIDIFNHLFTERNPLATVDAIVASINDKESNQRIPSRYLREAAYRDCGGIMGEPGAQYTDEDLEAYWNENNKRDPILREYRGNYNAWMTDTLSNMRRVNEAVMRRLKSCISTLNEDEMSDEDKYDSDLIRSMIQKMQNRSNASFSPEEKAVMAKYGIVRDNNQRKLRVDDRELNPDIDDVRSHYSYSRPHGYSNGTSSKINYADRARKLPARKQNQVLGDRSSLYGQNAQLNSHSGVHNIRDAERDAQNDKLQEPLRNMKLALTDRNFAQNNINNAEAARAKRMADAQAAYDKAKQDADQRYTYDTEYSARQRDSAQGRIDTLLKRNK